MCGLLGWAGKDPKDFNRSKFNIIGIANESRGTHSCGVSTDGKLFKGVGLKNKKYGDFIINSYYDAPKDIPVVIGHTRFATGGAHTEENAHPFRFDNEDGFMIGAHNGVIKNISELAKKYGIEEGNKIDSEILLEIISKDKLDVFEEYDGAAALLMYSSDKPNTLWVFRGESKEFNHSRTTESERPLFYYQETPNSMYISSLEEPLIAIVDKEEEKVESIKEFLTNTLYKIEDGAIKGRYRINRSERIQKPSKVGFRSTGCNSGVIDTTTTKTTSSNKSASTGKTIEGRYPSNIITSHKNNNIFYETVMFNDLKTEIYYENLQYKRNGHPVTGIYVFIKECGLVQLADKLSDVNDKLFSFNYYDSSTAATLSFGDIKGVTLYYIFNGWMLKDILDYKKCVEMESNNKTITATDFSHMSQYPVIDINRLKTEEKIYSSNQLIKQDGTLYTGIVKPVGSFCEYNIRFGELKSRVEHANLILPDTEVSNILDAFSSSVKWVENSDDEKDDSVFEEELSDKLFNGSPSDNEDIETVISLNKELTGLFEGAISQLTKLGTEEVRESSLVKSFIDFCNDSQNRYETIAENIKLWEEKVQSNI